ncbi:MAG TPA: universal stress protein [Dehalococcoidia bacterium]|nr:universal stress protein [Dehalococcoidia bacterium]
MLKTVLVPLDGSPLAEGVLPYAESLAQASGAELFLLTAIPEVATSGEYFGQRDLQKESEQAREYLAATSKQLSDLGLKIRTDVIVGIDVAGIILDCSQDCDADLIAMSTHGRTGITRWIYGSVTDKVLHHTHQPLLLVHSSKEEKPLRPLPVRRILVPLDGSPLAASVLPFVKGLAKDMGATIVLFHAVPPVGSYAGMAPDVNLGAVLEDLQKQGQEYLTQIAREIQAEGLETEAYVTLGFAVDDILRVSQEKQVDLIALGTHGRSGIGRWIMGSVTDAVLRRSALPCLVVRPEESQIKAAAAE